MQWGSASDNSRIYVSNHNSLFQDIDLTKMNSVPNTPGGAAPTKTNGGIAAAVDAYTGATPAWRARCGCGCACCSPGPLSPALAALHSFLSLNHPLCTSRANCRRDRVDVRQPAEALG